MKKIFKTIDDEISKLEKVKMDLLKEKIEGGEKMKIAVSATGKGLDSQVDMRFGRCPNFVIVELDGKEIKSTQDVENIAAGQMGGAGITSSQLVADRGVKAVITGNVGPRAFSVFEQLGIKIYQGSGTVKEVVEKFADGKLQEMKGATGPMFMGKPGSGQGAGIGAGMGSGAGRGMGRGQRSV